MNTYLETDFVYNLVLTLTGVDVNKVPEEYQDDIVSECLTLFIDYISYYIQEKYSVKDAIRIRTAYETGDNILTTFPELVPMYEEAYAAFINWLKENLTHAQEQVAHSNN